MSAQTRSKYIFEEAPIPNAVMTLAVPTIITQLINIIYNYADTWYVGRTGNAAMVAALSVCFPIFAYWQPLPISSVSADPVLSPAVLA